MGPTEAQGEGIRAQPRGSREASEKGGSYTDTWTIRRPGEQMDKEHVRGKELGVPKPEAGTSLASGRY